jgi:tRNA (guanine37-N1)-methyltransferase
MKISIITVFPELHIPFINCGIISKAVKKGLLEFNIIRLSDLCSTKIRIDEPICGPGVGMIIKPEVAEKAITKCEKAWGKGFKIFFSPQGVKFNQKLLQKLSHTFFSHIIDEKKKSIINNTNIITKTHKNFFNSTGPTNHIILFCSRYEGVDFRIEQHCADLLVSIGDFVLMGGDIPAQVFLEGILRYMPGIVGKQQSVEEDSFSRSFLDYPHYGLPVEWQKEKVPEILLSGNHKKIELWRKEEACKRTITNRFDWFVKSKPNKEAIVLAKKFIPNHYVALLHSQVMIKKKGVGHTSIASLDIHDISRSSKTYGIKNFFIVSKLEDQQTIMKTFLSFWHSEDGKKYNQSRYDAVAVVQPAYTFSDVVNSITQREGISPIVISTSAKPHENSETIDYFKQSQIWKNQQPVLLVFGTGQGLSKEILDQSDFIFEPINGLSDYNHLSVRSAVGIILDRWLGLHPKA